MTVLGRGADSRATRGFCLDENVIREWAIRIPLGIWKQRHLTVLPSVTRKMHVAWPKRTRRVNESGRLKPVPRLRSVCAMCADL